MKKLLTVLLALPMLAALAACGQKAAPAAASTATSTSSAAASASATKPTPEPTEDLSEYTANFGDCIVTIVGAEITEYWDEPVLRVYFDITNTDPSEIFSPLNTIDVVAYQSEEELEPIAPGEVPEDGQEDLHLKPGAFIRGTGCFELLDETTEVVVYVGDLTRTFDLAALGDIPEAPPRTLVANPEEPSAAEGNLGLEGDIVTNWGTSGVSILGSEVMQDDNGNDLIHLRFTFTNGAEDGDDDSPWMTLTIRVFQDGIELDEGDTWSFDDPELDAYHEDCPNGGTVTFANNYALVTGSKVEVYVTTFFDAENHAFAYAQFPAK